MIRTTTTSMHQALGQALQQNRNNYSQKQIQVASGQKFLKRSDDVASASQASQIESQRQDTLQYQRNVQLANTWTQVSGARLDQMLANMQRSNELTVQANTGIMDDKGRKQLSKEIDSILEDMLQIGNSRHADAYIFGGTISDQEPLTASRDADGNITAVTYNGNSSERKVQISDGQTATYGHPGNGSRGVFATADIDIFDSLIKLRNQLASGEQPDESVSKGVQAGLEHVISKVVEGGLQQQRLTTLSNGMTSENLALKSRVAELADLDLAKAFTELTQLESSLQVSLQMSARINQMSLMNYI